MDFTPLFPTVRVPTIFMLGPLTLCRHNNACLPSGTGPIQPFYSVSFSGLSVCGISHVGFLHVKQTSKPPISPTWYTPSLQLKTHTQATGRDSASLLETIISPYPFKACGNPQWLRHYASNLFLRLLSSLIWILKGFYSNDVYFPKVQDFSSWSWVLLTNFFFFSFLTTFCNCSGFVCVAFIHFWFRCSLTTLNK